MKIDLQYSSGYGYIVVEADNVNIKEDADSYVYGLLPDGKPDYSKRLGRDITDNTMNQFGKLMEDLAYYRDADWDGTTLIETLFERLPQDKVKAVLIKLNSLYTEETE